jgi:GNAT superfamily N-acetyltransferase
MGCRIEQARVADWRRTRAVRLRALADTPDAFGAMLADELNMSDEDWKARITQTDAATFLAAHDDADIGIIVAAPNGEGDVGLYSVWVAPEARGQGVGDDLVTAAINWARTRSHRRITLGVGDFNLPAIRLYERHGFARTGVIGTLPPPRTHITEHKRLLVLS